MMTPQEIKEGLTFPCGRWEAEPLLGSIYGQEELDAVTEAIKASMDFRNGFGFSSEPIFAFEKAMADYVGVRYAIAVNSCGPGMDIVMRSLHLQPGEEVIVPSIVKELGWTVEDARNFAFIGCQEITGSGNDYPAPNGSAMGHNGIFWAIALDMAINNGINPINGAQCPEKVRSG